MTTPIHGTSLWRDAWRRWRRHRVSVAAAVVVVGIVLFCVLGPSVVWLVWGHTYYGQDEAGAMGPSLVHPMGTDQLGRDVMVRTMSGGRVSLAVALVATSVSLAVGVVYGAVSGYAGGRVDSAMMRFVDIMMSTPYLLLVIVLMAIVPPGVIPSVAGIDGNFILIFAAIGLVSWLMLARIVRGQVLSLKEREFVEAARAIGVPPWRIVLRHIIPNTLGPVIVYTTLTLPSVMLSEAFLSFLGLGLREPQASWGTLVSDGANAMLVYPWMLIFPGVTMAVTLFCLNFMGDGLRDALDPRMSKG